MAARTSSQSGNWSASSTWGGATPPGDGDTATVSAGHTVTVDTDSVVGTSPNDATTVVLTLTGTLAVAAGKRLTVKGNVGGGFGCAVTVAAGGEVLFDASGSGGTPVYTTYLGGTFLSLTMTGTANSPAKWGAVAGQTCRLAANFQAFSLSHVTLTRTSLSVINYDGHATATDVLRDTCGAVAITTTSVSNNIQFTRVTTTGTDTGLVSVGEGAANSTGVRWFRECSFGGDFQMNGLNWEVSRTVIGGRWLGFPNQNLAATSTLNAVLGCGSTENLEGRLEGTAFRRWFFYAPTNNNPHYIHVHATAADVLLEQLVFQSDGAVSIDTGDCIFPYCSSGRTVRVNNCLVLPASNGGETSGSLLTGYSPSANRVTRWSRNTCHTAGDGAFHFAEGDSGVAGEIALLRGNLVWCDGGTAHLAKRISGTTDGHIDPAGADYNWTFGLAAGNNGRGYHDAANSPAQDLWSSGNADGNDAADAGVDAHQGAGDPQFHDAARNLQSWCLARGYGAATTAAAKAALMAAPRRVADLLDYLFEGFRPANASCRSFVDGGPVGAANYARPGRSLTRVTAIAATLTAYGL